MSQAEVINYLKNKDACGREIARGLNICDAEASKNLLQLRKWDIVRVKEIVKGRKIWTLTHKP